MRSRDAWLAAITAALGLADGACKKDATDAPATVREVTSVVASASASASASPTAGVAASAPSETASAEVVASASASPSASAGPKPTATIGFGSLLGDGPHTTIGSASGTALIGGTHINPSCGATSHRDPITSVSVNVYGGASDHDRALVQTNLLARFHGCANDAGQSNIQGDTMLQLAIDAQGAVTRVDAQGGSLGEPLVACMKTAARKVKFAEGETRNLRVRVIVDRRSF